MRAVESIAAMVPVRGVARYGRFAANDRNAARAETPIARITELELTGRGDIDVDRGPSDHPPSAGKGHATPRKRYLGIFPTEQEAVRAYAFAAGIPYSSIARAA